MGDHGLRPARVRSRRIEDLIKTRKNIGLASRSQRVENVPIINDKSKYKHLTTRNESTLSSKEILSFKQSILGLSTSLKSVKSAGSDFKKKKK